MVLAWTWWETTEGVRFLHHRTQCTSPQKHLPDSPIKKPPAVPPPPPKKKVSSLLLTAARLAKKSPLCIFLAVLFPHLFILPCCHLWLSYRLVHKQSYFAREAMQTRMYLIRIVFKPDKFPSCINFFNRYISRRWSMMNSLKSSTMASLFSFFHFPFLPM